MQKLCGKDSHTRDGFLELFVSVNSGKVKLRVQLRIVAFPPTCTSWDNGDVCGAWTGNLWVVSLDTVPTFFKGYICKGSFLAILGQAISEPNPAWGTGMWRHVASTPSSVHPFSTWKQGPRIPILKGKRSQNTRSHPFCRGVPWIVVDAV